MFALVLIASGFLVGGAAIHAPPTSPRRVLDGDQIEVDMDRSEWSAGFGANWSGSIDETGRSVEYEMCLRERHERCDDGSRSARWGGPRLRWPPKACDAFPGRAANARRKRLSLQRFERQRCTVLRVNGRRGRAARDVFDLVNAETAVERGERET